MGRRHRWAYLIRSVKTDQTEGESQGRLSCATDSCSWDWKDPAEDNNSEPVALALSFFRTMF